MAVIAVLAYLRRIVGQAVIAVHPATHLISSVKKSEKPNCKNKLQRQIRTELRCPGPPECPDGLLMNDDAGEMGEARLLAGSRSIPPAKPHASAVSLILYVFKDGQMISKPSSVC